MQASPVESIKAKLSGKIPKRYQLLHGFNPQNAEHREAADAISGRQVLAYLESRASSRFLAPHLDNATTNHEDAWLQGIEFGLLFWAKAARSRPSWKTSVALEVRDLLWNEGHALPPDGSWENALFHAARLLGLTENPVHLKQRQRAKHIQGIVGFQPGSVISNDALFAIGESLLRGLVAERSEIYQIKEVESKNHKVILEDNNGRLIKVARTSVWPLGCSVLQSRRQKVVAYCLDAFESARSWSAGSGFDSTLFFQTEAERLRNMAELWSCKDAPQ